MLQPVPSRNVVIEYASKEEKVCSQLMEHFLNWKPVLGKTYQYPLSLKHDADFYLPNNNLIVEYHPAVIQWYSAKGTYKALKRLEKSLSKRDFLEVTELVCNQISHEYYKRRRSIMDVSDNKDIRNMRLVVATDYADLYQQVIRPSADRKINHNEFLTFLERVR
jgi:hypothetical protein